MSNKLQEAVNALQQHRDQLAVKLDRDTQTVKTKQEGIKTTLEEIKNTDEALKKLGGKTPKAKSRKSKPSADKETTLATVIAVLTENAPQAIPGEDLKALTQERLREQGFSLTGVFKYWEKSLADAEEIIETEAGVYGLAQEKVSEVA